MSIPISVGIAGSRATSDMSGGPFFVDASIVFGDRYAGDNPYQGYSPNVSQTPTSEATGQGAILPSGSVPAQTVTGGLTGALGGSSTTTWLLLGGAAVAAWLIYKHGF